jgi:Domain of unknown function (DUF4328)
MTSPPAGGTYPPPPPLPVASSSARQRRTIQSLRGLSIALLVLFILLGFAYALLAAFIGARIALEGRILDGQTVTLSEATDADDSVAGAVFFVVLFAIPVFVLLVLWLWRAYSNVDNLDVGPRRYGRGWAIGAWFVPIANLFIPKQLINDSWRAADRDAPGNRRWTKLPIKRVSTAWWLTFLVSTLGIRAASVQIGDESIDDMRRIDWLALGASILAVASCVLGIVTVRMITQRQHRRAAGN